MTTSSGKNIILKDLLTGVDLAGVLPDSGDGRQLYAMVYSTRTERVILEAFADQALAAKAAANHAKIAWISEEKGGDQLVHPGLAETLAASSEIKIIPVGVAWKPKSDRRQSWREIVSWMSLIESNRRQRGVLKRTPERCAIIIGEVGERGLLESRFRRQPGRAGASAAAEQGDFAEFVAQQAALTIERDARTVTGETIKYPRFVKRSIWMRPDFQNKLAEIAQETGESLKAVQDNAQNCLKELVPKVRAPHVSFSTAFARKVCRLGYEDKLVYDTEKIRRIRDIARTRPTALVWTHKTHIDGFAMMMASRDEAFPLVHIIGGENMAFFGIGYLMRRSGTVFIRRSIDCPVYKTVLQFYLSYLLEKRFPVSWALEGTRSRNGKLMPPRFGILKYVVEAAAKEQTRDLTIVPISIYYDLIAELGDYAGEQTGATKRKESIAWFADYLRSLRKPLGRISLGLGEPVVVDTASEAFTDLMKDETGKFSIELQKLAFEASVKANAATPITPSSILSLALTGASPQALTEKELTEELRIIRDWAADRGYPLTEDLATPDARRLRRVASSMIKIGVVSQYDGGPNRVYSIAEGKHFEASYYRNNAIHFFVNKAIIELALAKTAEADPSRAVSVFTDEAVRIRDTFKFEFFYPEHEVFMRQLSEELERYNQDWKASLAAGKAMELLSGMAPLVSHAVLRPFAEAYSIVADVLQEQDEASDVDEKSVVAAALHLGKQAFLQRRITSEESIGKLMFSNGYKLAENRGLAPGGGVAMKAARQGFAREMQELSLRLRQIGEIAAQERSRSARSFQNSSENSHLSVVG